MAAPHMGRGKPVPAHCSEFCYPMRNSTEQHLFLTRKTNLEVEGSGLASKPRSQGECRLFLGCRL